MTGKDKPGMIPLTKPQLLIYNTEKYAGGAAAVICGSVLFSGSCELSELHRAVNMLYRINGALRTRIIETAGGTMQMTAEFAERCIETLCFTEKTSLDAYAADYAREPLDLYGSLCEIRVVKLPGRYGALIKLHHIIGDAWSLSLLASQFYAILHGKTPEAGSYEDYAASEQDYLQSKRCENDRAFFLRQFQKCREATLLSEKRNSSLVAARRTFTFDALQSRRISDYAHAHRTSPFALFMTVLAVYLNRIRQNAEQFYIGTTVFNRIGTREKNTAGMFVNTVPVLAELDNEQSFADNLASVEASLFSVFRHQKYNYGDILTAVREEYGFTERLYDVMLSYQNAGIEGDAESTWYPVGVQAESLQIHIEDRDHEGTYKLHYDYQTVKFTEQQISRLHEHLCRLLSDALAHDDRKPYELDMLTADEQTKLLHVFNDTAAEYPKDKCIHTLFEEQAVRTPDKTAVLDGSRALTYRELNEQANVIAHRLIEKGISVGDIVAFALPRTSQMIAVMLGILKSGAAYMPVDPDYPQERIEFMLEDSKAKICVTEELMTELLSGSNLENPEISVSGSDLCYCIYTSGSTGKPKGTLLRHRGIVNLITDTAIYRDLSRCSRVGLMTSITFDVASQEILTALLNGLTGILMPERKKSAINRIIDDIVALKVDLIFTTPTYFDTLTSTHEKAEKLLSTVKVVALAGEPFYLNRYVVRCQPEYDTLFENHYGPAETHVITAASIKSMQDITIGKPIANTQIYITDKYLNPVPIGVTGELCIAGDGVGAGYLNRPELTAEKFIDNPFGQGRLYRTGDLAYWREDGNIVYVGRSDFQVKIRGLRIELGEIENVMNTAEGISQTAVVVRKDGQGRQLICAFYTGAEMPAKELRSFIGQKLPKYMLPHVLVHLERLPLTSSGKVDRKALPKVDLNNIERNAEYAAPEGEVEMRLAALMERVLHISPIGRDDDFFDLGGDSLKAIEFVSLAHTEGVYMAVQAVFDHPTVRRLAAHIAEENRPVVPLTNTDFSAIDHLLAKNSMEYAQVPRESPVGNLLLTGATGFLGSHILADFLEHDDGTAYCLVRGKNEADSQARLAETLRCYFGKTYTADDRIRVLCGDLTKDRFGLPEDEYEELLQKTDTVINAAATVKHFGSYQYFYETNVETVDRLIGFCEKGHARLVHISTTGVSGMDSGSGAREEGETVFSEKDLYIGQSLENVYERSKFEAEFSVLRAIGRGLPANIMRMGNLTNRASDGLFQKNYQTNAFLQRFRAFLELGAVPDYLTGMGVDFTPVDEAAAAVMTLTRHFNTDQTVFHIQNDKLLPLGKLIVYMTELGCPLKSVDEETFTGMLSESAGQNRTSPITTFVRDLDGKNRLSYSHVHIDTSFTAAYLQRLGFAWSETDREYLRKYLKYFEMIGYWRDQGQNI